MNVEGRCHCGAIQFQATVNPQASFICHCFDCQTLSGSAFRLNVSASAEGFCIIKGCPKKYVKTAESGTRRVHAFCDNCGSPVYSCTIENPEKYTLRVGTLEQRSEIPRPFRQTWTKRRFQWLEDFESIPACEGQM
ncbi:GFA family protein [Paraburkholderia sediminicola]|uniref:GFA family protein n=1 Tax=Paraburkholderia sediminicola TaxID=458836 RepID=UPI0038BB6185